MNDSIQSEFKTFLQKATRKSPILRKCEDLMETLWTEGYLQQISLEELRTQVQLRCGAFRTTVTDYLGNRNRQGHLEKFGFIERLVSLSHSENCILQLHHEKVNRPYHTNHEALSFSLSHREEEEEVEEDIHIHIPIPTVPLLPYYSSCREREIKESSEPFNPNLWESGRFQQRKETQP